ncbi:MAG: hypothetical protein ACHQF2_05645 [Flavobacteriales bacterium]
MKKYILVFLFPLLTITPSRAQWGIDAFAFMVQAIATCDEGGYEYKQTLFRDRVGEFHGVKFAWAPGQKFTLGMSAYFGSNLVHPWNSNDAHRLIMSYATVYGEYHFRKEEKFYNWSALLHVGRGYSTISGSNIPSNFQNSSAFWVFEPGINFNICAFRFLRFNAGASYRVVSGARLYGQSDGSLSGPCLNVGLTISGRGF